jgi:histidyl-tRNA synthetase
MKEIQSLKGTKDLNPEEKILREEIIEKIKRIFEIYGYSPIETSILKMLESLTAKYAGGEEITKEIYKLKDQGERNLGLRFDLTVPLALFISENPNTKMPFKRYETGKVFRDGPIKLGRLREFWQCDVDIIGSKNMISDSEILSISKDVFEDLGIKTEIKVNNRKILNGIMTFAEIKNRKEEAILSIDKIEKIGEKEVKKELEEKGFTKEKIEKLFEIITLKEKNEKIIEILKEKINDEEGKEGIKEIEELFSYLKIFGVNAKFDLSLARGLAYYTGTIFEIFAKKGEFRSALAGGGRYDRMIGKFLETEKEYPAVGISFGIEPITEIIKKIKEKTKKTVTEVFLIQIKTTKESLEICQKLRKKGIKTEIDIMERGISKNLAYADSLKIPFVIFIGEKEIKENKIKIRNMETGEEKLISLEKTYEFVKNSKETW